MYRFRNSHPGFSQISLAPQGPSAHWNRARRGTWIVDYVLAEMPGRAFALPSLGDFVGDDMSEATIVNVNRKKPERRGGIRKKALPL